MRDANLRSHVGGFVIARLVDGREVLGKLWQLRLSQASYAIEAPESAISARARWIAIGDASEVEWVLPLGAQPDVID